MSARIKAKHASMMNHKPVAGSASAVDTPTASGTPKRARRQSSAEAASSGKSTGGRNMTTAAMDAKRNVTIDHSVHEEVCTNTYSSDVLKLIVSKRALGGGGSGAGQQPSVNPSVLKEQMSRQRFKAMQVTPEAKGLEVTEAIKINQAVAEYTGNVMLREEYEHDKQCDVSFPFVLCYTGLDGVEVCIDASISSNEARYIRCSCTPNAKVLHVLEQNAIRFYICATKNLTEGREITIPFHFDYRKGACEVKCACGRPACPVARFFSNKSNSRGLARTAAVGGAVGGSSGGGGGIKRKSQSELELGGSASPLNSPAAAPAAASAKQKRKSRAATTDKDTFVPQDVGADVTLVNKLMDLSPVSPSDTAASAAPATSDHPQTNATTTGGGGASHNVNNNNSKIATSAGGSSKGRQPATAAAQELEGATPHTTLAATSADDHAATEGGGAGARATSRASSTSQQAASTPAAAKATPSTGKAAATNTADKNAQQQSARKTREQKKIEAVEKAFEKIEKVNVKTAKDGGVKEAVGSNARNKQQPDNKNKHNSLDAGGSAKQSAADRNKARVNSKLKPGAASSTPQSAAADAGARGGSRSSLRNLRSS